LGDDPIGQRDAKLLSDMFLFRLRWPLLLLLYALCFFELPLWCQPGLQPDKWSITSKPCMPADPSSQFYLSGLPYVPPAVGVLVELICYVAVLAMMGLELRWRGVANFVRGEQAQLVCYVALAILGVVDTLVFAGTWQSTFRLGPYVRLALIAITEPLRTTLLSTCESLPPYLRIVAVLVGVFVLFAFVMSLLLTTTPEDPRQLIPQCRDSNETDCPYQSDGFENFEDALFSSVFMAACQSFPDLLIPSYSYNRAFGLLWLSHFVIINFVLLNVVLATVFNAYQTTFRKNTVVRFKNRALGLFEAYDELVAERRGVARVRHGSLGAEAPAAAAAEVAGEKAAHPMVVDGKAADGNAAGGAPAGRSLLASPSATADGVTFEQFLSLIHELNRSMTVRYVPPQQLEYLFKTLDDDGNGTLDRDEFADLADSLNFHYSCVRTQNYVERHLPGLWSGLRLQLVKEWTESERWHGLPALMVVVMLLNAFAIIAQAMLNEYNVQTSLDAGVGAVQVPAFAWIYFGFSVLYLLETTSQLLTQPWQLFFVEGSRLTMVGISAMNSIISILWVLPFVQIPYGWMRYANIIRVLKLIRVFTALSSDFDFVLTSVIAIMRGSIDVIAQLFLWTSFFVVIATQAFGGSVYATNPALADSGYADSFYEVLNFNDFAMGFVPFIVTLVDGGPSRDIILGLGSASGRMAVSKIVFFAYYYTTHLLVLNIFVSFIVNGYTLRHEAREDLQETIDGLDSSQRENLQSLYSALPPLPGWTVRVSGREGQDVLLRRIFQEDIDRATEDASADQLVSASARREKLQHALSGIWGDRTLKKRHHVPGMPPAAAPAPSDEPARPRVPAMQRSRTQRLT